MCNLGGFKSSTLLNPNETAPQPVASRPFLPSSTSASRRRRRRRVEAVAFPAARARAAPHGGLGAPAAAARGGPGTSGRRAPSAAGAEGGLLHHGQRASGGQKMVMSEGAGVRAVGVVGVVVVALMPVTCEGTCEAKSSG